MVLFVMNLRSLFMCHYPLKRVQSQNNNHRMEHFFTAWMQDVIHTGGGTGLRAECWSVALLGRRVSEKHDCHLHCVLCTVLCNARSEPLWRYQRGIRTPHTGEARMRDEYGCDSFVES